MASDLEILNSGAHRDLRLAPAQIGAQHFVRIVAGEIASAAAHCPVVFSKNPEDGRFYVGAMLGFVPGENLLADEDLGAAGFRPLDAVREGFFVAGPDIAIDPRHPRFRAGAAMFEDDGHPSDALREVQHALGRLKVGLAETDAFIDALLKVRAIEALDVSMRFDDGEQITLAGVYTVSLDALHELDDPAALALFRSGHLQLAYLTAGSLKQIPVLAGRRNRLLALA
ncbi:MAG: SapC family protein [Sphingomonas sp.]